MTRTIDTCDTMRNNLIAAALGLQQCTKTAANIVPLPGTERFVTIGAPAEVWQLLRRQMPAEESPPNAGAVDAETTLPEDVAAVFAACGFEIRSTDPAEKHPLAVAGSLDAAGLVVEMLLTDAGRAVRPLRNHDDHAAALEEIQELMLKDLECGSPESDRLELLAVLVEAYELQHFAILPAVQATLPDGWKLVPVASQQAAPAPASVGEVNALAPAVIALDAAIHKVLIAGDDGGDELSDTHLRNTLKQAQHVAYRALISIGIDRIPGAVNPLSAFLPAASTQPVVEKARS